MDFRDLTLLLWTLGILMVLGVVSYAIDDLHYHRKVEDDIDRELRELIDRDS